MENDDILPASMICISRHVAAVVWCKGCHALETFGRCCSRVSATEQICRPFDWLRARVVVLSGLPSTLPFHARTVIVSPVPLRRSCYD